MGLAHVNKISNTHCVISLRSSLCHMGCAPDKDCQSVDHCTSEGFEDPGFQTPTCAHTLRHTFPLATEAYRCTRPTRVFSCYTLTLNPLAIGARRCTRRWRRPSTGSAPSSCPVQSRSGTSHRHACLQRQGPGFIIGFGPLHIASAEAWEIITNIIQM